METSIFNYEASSKCRGPGSNNTSLKSFFQTRFLEGQNDTFWVTLGTFKLILKYLVSCDSENILQAPKAVEIIQVFGLQMTSFDKYDL